MKMRSILDFIPHRSLIRQRFFLALLALLCSPLNAHAGDDPYQTTDAFLAEAFPGGPPKAAAIWMREAVRKDMAQVLGHAPPPRYRYWQAGKRTVWILDEIGKDQPITAGVIIDDGAIADIRVLVFRESRGWEVRHDFFTRQFRKALLGSDHQLDRRIDGITGATLSVRAMTRMARVALLLDARTRGQAAQLASAR